MVNIIPNKIWKMVSLVHKMEAALGANAGAAVADSSTVILSFCPAPQWPLTPQMYHLFPAAANLMVSFPVNEPKLRFVGTLQLWKSVPFTLYTL